MPGRHVAGWRRGTSDGSERHTHARHHADDGSSGYRPETRTELRREKRSRRCGLGAGLRCRLPRFHIQQDSVWKKVEIRLRGAQDKGAASKPDSNKAQPDYQCMHQMKSVFVTRDGLGASSRVPRTLLEPRSQRRRKLADSGHIHIGMGHARGDRGNAILRERRDKPTHISKSQAGRLSDGIRR